MDKKNNKKTDSEFNLKSFLKVFSVIFGILGIIDICIFKGRTYSFVVLINFSVTILLLEEKKENKEKFNQRLY